MAAVESSLRRLSAVVGTVLLCVGAVALVACSNDGELAWTEFGLIEMNSTSTPSSGTTPESSVLDTIAPTSTTTEPVYSGRGAWLYISSNEVQPGSNYSVQVIGFEANTEVTVKFRTASGTTTTLGTFTTDDKGGKIKSYQLPATTPEGDHRVQATGLDAAGDEVTVGQRLTVDLTKPTFGTASATPELVAPGQSVIIGLEVNDTFGVAAVYIAAATSRGATATWCEKKASLSAGSDKVGLWRIACSIPSSTPDGTYVVAATALDYSENTATYASASVAFTVSGNAPTTTNGSTSTTIGGGSSTTVPGPDVSPPTVSDIEVSPLQVDRGTAVRLLAPVADPSGVKSVSFTIKKSGVTMTWCPLVGVLGGIEVRTDGTWELWETDCTVPNEATLGTYSVDVTVEDNLGHAVTLQNQANFEVISTDTSGPVISNISTPASATLGVQFTISATVTDDSGVLDVTFTVYDSDGGVTSVSATLVSGTSTNGTWSATVTVSLDPFSTSTSLDAYVTVDAIDIYANSSSSDSSYFTIS